MFVNFCGNNALCTSESPGDFRLRRLGFLIAGDPNMTWLPNFGPALNYVNGSQLMDYCLRYPTILKS
ncbi:hypothetical protein TNCV_1423301 [Trichonephila clavipes]|nr:hypothetical protein TNCV_1423301 [Trichonephila clavipes]